MFVPPGFLLSLLIGVFWLIALAVLAVMWFARVKERRAARSRINDVWCRKCGYSLRGRASPGEPSKCPECGAALDEVGAIRHGNDPVRLSWRGRIIVMSIVTLYPLLATAYNVHLFAALQEWFVHDDSIQLSNPRSRGYVGVTIAAELTDLRIWRRGRVQASVDGPAGAPPAGVLTVQVPSMRAIYTASSDPLPLERTPLDTAFVLEWMRSAGVPVTDANAAKVTAEAEAVRLEIERMADASPRTSATTSVTSNAFAGWASGMRLWVPWRPGWFWPVATMVIVGVWLVLALLVRPRQRSKPAPQ